MAAKLSGKVAVVTGASKGIGAGIARQLAAEGASVVVNYSSSREGADKVVAAIQQAGGAAIAVGANVAQADEIGRLFAAAKAEFGRVDVLVNNAAIYNFAPLGEITEDHFHQQFNLNVLGLILATQEAVRHFGPAGGSVINISSVAATSPAAGLSVYSATKGAVDTLTKGHATELGSRKIRVNAISPGLVATEGTSGFIDSDFAKGAVAQTPLGRVGQPDDIAKVAVFLASDDAAWITGEIIRVAGGWPA